MRKCLIKGRKAMFHQWVNRAYVIGASISVGGHPAGQISDVVALIEYEDGTVAQIETFDITFLDKPEEIEDNSGVDFELLAKAYAGVWMDAKKGIEEGIENWKKKNS